MTIILFFIFLFLFHLSLLLNIEFLLGFKQLLDINDFRFGL